MATTYYRYLFADEIEVMAYDPIKDEFVMPEAPTN